MPYVSYEDALDHLSLSGDMVEGLTVSRKLEAAQNHVERLLGYKFSDRFLAPGATAGEGEERGEFPASLREAVLQLVAWWFENREAAGPAMREVPFGVREIVAEYRGWTF